MKKDSATTVSEGKLVGSLHEKNKIREVKKGTEFVQKQNQGESGRKLKMGCEVIL